MISFLDKITKRNHHRSTTNYSRKIVIHLYYSRFKYFYNNRSLFQEQINSNSLYLNQSQERNFYKWPILGVYIWPNNVYFSTYDEEVIYLKEWLNERLEWLNQNLDEL